MSNHGDDLPFGLVMEGVDPRVMDQDTIRGLLSRHGVIVFRGLEVDHAGQSQVMSMLGKVQTWVEQQAPKSYANPDNSRAILLDNDDFLGRTRMFWHMDQTYLTSDYLPVRSLYCTHVDSENATEFVDVAYLTSMVNRFYPMPDDTEARYYIDSARTRYGQRCIFSECSHVGRKLLRYDKRMELVNRTDSAKFGDFCHSVLNSNEIPKLVITWQTGDFVIFDNNRCPHRRSVMNGDCRLSRFTSSFWLA